MVNYHDFLERLRARETQTPITSSEPADLDQYGERKVLCEYQAKSLLAEWRLPVPAGVLARTAQEAVQCFEKHPSPKAMKIQSPDIPHKTDAGGVLLNLDSAQAVEDGFSRLLQNALEYDPAADIHGVLLEPMSAPGLETIIGVYPDKDFGLMLTAGAGGIYAEVLADAVVASVPVSRERAERLLQELKMWQLLTGTRGNDPADVAALVDLMSCLSGFAKANAAQVAEIDLNPVIVHPEGQGLTIADALIVRVP